MGFYQSYLITKNVNNPYNKAINSINIHNINRTLTYLHNYLSNQLINLILYSEIPYIPHKHIINLCIIQNIYKSNPQRPIEHMINHHTILREQLKKISNNINKKYIVLRKQILKTQQVFDNEQIPVFPYEVCFSLFKQIIQTGSVSSSMAFLPFLQNIINLGFSNADMSRQILTLLTHTKSIPKFPSLQNQTKMLQILAILVSKNCIDLKNLNFTYNLFNIVLSLQNTKYRTLWIKSTTILYQTFQLLVNDIRDNPSQQKITTFTKFLSDITHIINGQKINWLIEYADPFILLQIFQQLLDDKYIIQNGQTRYKQILLYLLTVVRKQLRKCIDTVNSLMTSSSSSSSLHSRSQSNSQNHIKNWQLSNQNKILILLRTGCKINILTKQGFDFIEQLIKIISQKKPTIYKLLAYQAINYLFRNSIWILNLFQSEYADLFNFLLTTEFNTIKYLLSQQKQKIDLVNFVIGHDTHYNRIMGTNYIDLNIVEFNYSYQIKLIVKNLQEVTYALYAIYCQKFKIDMNQKIQGKPPLQKTYKFCQKTVFETIKTILSKDMSEDTLQSLLKIAQKFINMSGCFNDSSVSAIYIKLMCKYCLPTQFKNIDHRHIQINKMILNTANCLGHLFTSSCWVIVWKTLQNYSIYYNRYLLGKQQLQSARQSDVQILYKSMDSIFTQSNKYNDKYLLQVIRSLIEVAYQCLQNNYNDQTRKIFAFQRIQQIYKLNLFRICIIWPQLSSSLLCITTSKVLYFRVSALNLLNTLIPQSLNYLKNHQQILKQPFTKQNYQQLLLQPWINLVNCQFQQIKDQFILAVNKLIIDYGHIMTNGWKCIMEIIKKTNDLKSLQAIVQTFLQKVHDNIMDIVISVDTIQRKLYDTNQKYLCLTMIWSIADYARKNQQFQVLKKIYHILLVPEEMFNLGTQARHSSFYIFAEIVVHNCMEKSQQFWVWIFDQICRFYTYGINQCLNAKNKNFGQQALKNLITNLIKIYKKFFIVSKQWQNKQQIINKLIGNFYTFCSSVLQFRSPQIYQNIIKQSKQIIIPKIKQSINIPQLYIYLQTLTQLYFVQNDSKILKCLITYLPPDIYDILGVILYGLDNNFIVIYRLQAQQKDIKLQQLRIFFEQKYHYQYMKKMQNYIIQQKPTQLCQIYIQNISKTIHKLKLYQDYLSLSKFLQFLTITHIKLPQIQSKLTLQTIKQLIKIRYQENWIKSINLSNCKDIPIWYIAIQDLIKIGYEYLHKQMKQEAANVYNILIEILLNQQQQYKQDKQKQRITKVINSYSKDTICYHYQGQIQICYFLFQNYYLSNKQYIISKQTQRQYNDVKKVAMLIYNRSQCIIADDHTRKGYNAYQLLFKIANDRGKQNYIHNKIQQNQSIIVCLLMERIIKTFDKIKIGKNQQIIIQQLKFILKQMLILKLKYKIFNKISDNLIRVYVNNIKINSIVLQLNQAHLFFFQQLLAKCIRCQDNQTLELIQNYMEKTAQILMNLEIQQKQVKLQQNINKSD